VATLARPGALIDACRSSLAGPLLQHCITQFLFFRISNIDDTADESPLPVTSCARLAGVVPAKYPDGVFYNSGLE